MERSKSISRRRFLKFAGIGVTSAAGLLVAAACSPVTGPGTPASGTAAAPTLATAPSGAAAAQSAGGAGPKIQGVTVRYLTVPDTESSAREVAKEFEQLYGAKADVSVLPGLQLRDKVLSESIANTGAYDVVNISPWWIGELGPFLEPIDQYLKDPAVVASDFAFDEFPADLLKSYTTFNDRLVGLPSHVDLMMLLYRTDLFDDPKEKDAFKQKYGLELTPPTTWDDYSKAAEFFTRPDQSLWGVAAMGKRSNQDGAQWINRFFAFGGRYFDDKNHPLINSDAGVKAADHLVQVVKNYAPNGVLTYDFAEARQAFWQGKAAMMEAWPGSVVVGAQDPKQSQVVGKVNGVVMPGGHGCGGGWFHGISVDSKNKLAAYKWLELLSTRKSQKIAYQLNGRMPSRQSLYADADIQMSFPTGFADQFKQAAAQSLPPPNKFPEDAQLQDELDRRISETISGQAPPKDAMDAANQAWADILQRAGRLG